MYPNLTSNLIYGWLVMYATLYNALLIVAENQKIAIAQAHLEQDREAALAAIEICQKRMLEGAYGNDAEAMAKDIEIETDLQKILRRK